MNSKHIKFLKNNLDELDIDDGFTSAVMTPAYSAPEVIMGDVRNIDIKADIYSFGVLMWEVFTGRIPKMMVKYGIDDKIEYIQNTPKDIIDLIKVCTSINKDERPTIKEVYEILKKNENEQSLEIDLCSENINVILPNPSENINVILPNPNRFLENCEYKLFNKKWKGPLFCGDGTDSQNDHRVWVEKNVNYENNGKERWYIKCVDNTNQIYKIFNKKWKGPLFCGDGTDRDNDHHIWVEKNINYENNGKERWKIIPIDNQFKEFKLTNVKWGGPLFCGDGTDSSGDHYAWVAPTANYEQTEKERWFISKC